MLPSFYHDLLEKYLTPAQLLTLQMLVWLLQNRPLAKKIYVTIKGFEF